MYGQIKILPDTISCLFNISIWKKKGHTHILVNTVYTKVSNFYHIKIKAITDGYTVSYLHK